MGSTSNKQVLVTEILRHIADQYQPLLRNCALSRVQQALPKKTITGKTNPKNNAEALSVVTLISVLLYKSGRTKEIYMNDFAFQLGQLCSAMDEIHIGYCVSERSGSIPNTLLGNQVYGMALLDHAKAMAFMATRVKPYESWVRRIRFKDDKMADKVIKNAVYAQKWMGKQASEFKKSLQKSGIATSDSYKAELMLGYLSGRPFEQKKDAGKSNNDKGEKK